jgi:hypothetical protein
MMEKTMPTAIISSLSCQSLELMTVSLLPRHESLPVVGLVVVVVAVAVEELGKMRMRMTM